MKLFSSVLVKLVLLGLILSPFLVLYWFIVDPIHCIVNLIGAWLWFIMVIVPLTIVILILWGIGSLILSIFRDLIDLFKK